jgi:hypothetical protein
MPTRYHARFPERHDPAPPSRAEKGGVPPKADRPMRTAAWPTAGAGKGADFNRATKAEVVQDTPKKAGVA